MDSEDEFFDHFRNKDISKMKKFTFKKDKSRESPEKLSATSTLSSDHLNRANLSKKIGKSKEISEWLPGPLPIQKLTIAPKHTSRHPTNYLATEAKNNLHLEPTNINKSTNDLKEKKAEASRQTLTFKQLDKTEDKTNSKTLFNGKTSKAIRDTRGDTEFDIDILHEFQSSPLKKFQFKKTNPNVDLEQSCYNPITNPQNKTNESVKKKFTFKKVSDVTSKSTLANGTNSKLDADNRKDNILDNLYKKTGSPTKPVIKSSSSSSSITSGALKTQKPLLNFQKNGLKQDSLEHSSSLLSGTQKLTSKGTLNISKYFNNTVKNGVKKTCTKENESSPFKKILQTKQSNNSNLISNNIKKNDSKSIKENDIQNNSLDHSPIVKPKKFVFKKKSVNASISSSVREGEKELDLDKILGDDELSNLGNVTSTSTLSFNINNISTNLDVSTIQGTSVNSLYDNDPSSISTTTTTTRSKYLEQEELGDGSKRSFKNPVKVGLNDPAEKSFNEFGLTANKQLDSVCTKSSLAITDDDYMNDEEFERMFGILCDEFEEAAQESSDIAAESNTTIEPKVKLNDRHDTDELLMEISNMNWDENVFEDEPMKEGFKDRNDNSEEFKGQYEHSEVMLEVLHQKFGLRSFRPHQREIINASLMQHDCFVLMPTGGGKSLCYQLPAILMPGVTIVISPLRALISDQVDKLNALDIAAAHLCSDVSKSQGNQIYMKLSMREPGLKLLYLTPEKINASRQIIDVLNSLYHRGKLARFVIDEVHCLSQWGHDFRPDYKQLGQLRLNYKDVPIICLTATATKQVENDVVNILKLKNVKRFIRSFNRPNIKYEVVDKKGKSSESIVTLIKTKFLKKSGIVYCLARKDCDNLADEFNRLGVKAKPYHAGMTDKVREAIQREWMQDRFHVIVATIAFGMGIDKPDVRFVIHNSIPKSVEAFYQESGRAGRDGEVSYSYLFYSYGDVARLKRLIQMDRSMSKKTLEAHFENLKQMVSYAENVVDCRRYLQLIHLGEHFDRRICIKNKSTTCDNCENIDKYEPLDVTTEAKQLCTVVKDISGKENVTMLHVVDVYRGAKIKKIVERKHNQHRFYGAGAQMDRNDVQRVLKELILKQVLQDVCTYTGDFPVVYISPGPKFYQFYNSDYRLSISVTTEKRQKKKDVPEINREEDCSSTSSSTKSNGWIGGSKVCMPTEVVRHSVQKQKTSRLQAARKVQLSQIKVQCHEELLEECRRLAMERNLTLSSVMNLSAIKSMSDHLPVTKEEMLKIQHVTAANYNKYGECFLAITRKFRLKHDEIQPLAELNNKKELGESIQNFSEDDDDFYPSNSPNSKASTSSNKGRGVKRRGGWKGKRGGFKRKKLGVKKKKGNTSTKPSTSGWKAKGSSLGLMPVHIK